MGFPSPAADREENTLHLDDLIVHPAATYFIKMTGVAMEPTIHHGDILVLDELSQVITRSAETADAAGKLGALVIQLAPIAATLWQVAQHLFGG